MGDRLGTPRAVGITFCPILTDSPNVSLFYITVNKTRHIDFYASAIMCMAIYLQNLRDFGCKRILQPYFLQTFGPVGEP